MAVEGLPCSGLAVQDELAALGWVTGVATETLQPNS